MSIRKEMWKLAWPVMLISTMQTLFSIFDLLFISWLGTNQNAGAGIATSVIGVIMVFPMLISSGTTAIASRAVGAKDDKEFSDVSKQAVAYSLILGIGMYFVSLLLKNWLLGIFGVTDEVYKYAESYIDIVYLTIPIGFMISVLVSVLNSKGDTKTPMWFLGIGNIINIIFDYVFIMQLDLGISGAAYATFIGEAFALIALIIKVLQILNLSFFGYIKGIRLTVSMLIRFLKIGIYAVIYGITRPFTGMIMFKIAAESGMAAVAAFNTGGRLFSFLFIFFGGLEVAISILTGQSLGNNNVEKTSLLVKEGIRAAFVCIIIFAVPFVIFPKYLIMVFLKDPTVLLIGSRYMRIVYIGLLFIVFVTVFNAVMKGAGYTMPSMFGALIGNWAVKIPLAMMLSKTALASDGVWIAIASSVFAECIVVWFFYRQGKWKTKVV